MKKMHKRSKKKKQELSKAEAYFSLFFFVAFLTIIYLLLAEPFELGEKKIGAASSLHLNNRGVPVGLMVTLDDNQSVLARSNDGIILSKGKKVLIREYRSKFVNRKKYIFMEYLD